MIGRREFTFGAGGGIIGIGRPAHALSSLREEFARIETGIGGRLGVAVLDTRDGSATGYRSDERFAMCSTFKALAGAAVLSRVDAGKEQLDRRVRYDAKHLMTYSPVTEKHVDTGMTLAEICEAAITLSDNTAGNLQLAAIGGPEGFTAYMRTLGDQVTRLDRIETELNEAAPGDPRDTTTPAAMTENLRKLVLGECALDEIARATEGLARRQQDRRHAPARGRSGRTGSSATRPAPADAGPTTMSASSGRSTVRRWSCRSISPSAPPRWSGAMRRSRRWRRRSRHRGDPGRPGELSTQ